MRMIALMALLLGCADADKPADSASIGTETDAGADTDTTGDFYHPAGYSASGVHGLAAKHQQEDCRSCHGDDLTGDGLAVSCDSCHEDGWRTDCTFCHGGVDNVTGAPPEDISDGTDPTTSVFPPHTTHVEVTSLKRALDCVECHVKPTDALAVGHLFVSDTTPAVAEVSFAAGLSSAASWDGAGTCTNNYCHGTGQGNDGTVTATSRVSCGTCHAISLVGAEGMSGEHLRHIGEDVLCSECHAEVVGSSGGIADIDLHVDGAVSMTLPDGVYYVSDTCTGLCHSEVHVARGW